MGARRRQRTESVVMKDPAAAVALLTRLKQLGMGLSMDDFGTGYSSLTQLKRLPLDRLKIDRAFVRDVLTDAADQAVVQAVIAMGHALRLRVIAEGVETTGQRELLARLGCDEVQGYLCGRPGPAALIEAELGLSAAPAPA
jgi:EAL domain-containing protein (putative c-di-GMP-specific phosphodiesterase class I)